MSATYQRATTMPNIRPQFARDVVEAFKRIEAAEFSLHELAWNAIEQLEAQPPGHEVEDAHNLIRSILDYRKARICIRRATEHAEQRGALICAREIDDIITDLETAFDALARDNLAVIKRVWPGHDEAAQRAIIAREKIQVAIASALTARGGTA